MPTKERVLKISRADLSFSYTSDGCLEEAKLMIIPLKKSVRDRKFDQKIPIVIPARAGPFLKCPELLWVIVALNPCAQPRRRTCRSPYHPRIYSIQSGR